MVRACALACILICALAAVMALGLLAGPSAFGQNEPAAAPAASGREHECLSRQEQRVAVHQGGAIRLSMAVRSIHARDGDELLRAELCRKGSGLVYVLTILSRTGKVSRAIVDARSGAVIKDR